MDTIVCNLHTQYPHIKTIVLGDLHHTINSTYHHRMGPLQPSPRGIFFTYSYTHHTIYNPSSPQPSPHIYTIPGTATPGVAKLDLTIYSLTNTPSPQKIPMTSTIIPRPYYNLPTTSSYTVISLFSAQPKVSPPLPPYGINISQSHLHHSTRTQLEWTNSWRKSLTWS